MADNDPGVPLAHFLEHHPAVGVRFTCCACQASHDVPVARVIERLKVRGIGDERTGIRAVAALAERPCAHCRAMAWETRPAWRLPGT